MRIRVLLKKQEGMALALVMIIFMAVAVLGTIIATLSLGEVKQAVVLDEDMRAYYQARSAADATTCWIRNELLDLHEIEYAYLQLEDSLDKTNGELAADSLIPAKVTENMAALGTALENYDESADISDKAKAIRKISCCLDAMNFIPDGETGGPLDPLVEEELIGYLSEAEAAGLDAQDEHDAKEADFVKVVKADEDEVNSATVSSTGNSIIPGVQGVEVLRQNADDKDYIYTRANAQVNGVSSSAVVRLNETAIGEVAGLFSDAIYAASDVKDINGNSYIVEGRVSYGNICEDIKHDNINIGPEENDGVVYPDWNPPGDLTVKAWSAGGSKDTKAVALTSGAYNGTANAKGYYSINTAGGDVTLHIEKFDMSVGSTITVNGSGNAYIFIDAINDPSKKIQLNIKVPGAELDKPDAAHVYLVFDKTVSYVNWTGSCKVDAYVYAPEAVVDIGGGTVITGAIITNNYVSANGNFEVHYRPCNLKLRDYADDSEGGNIKQWLKEEQWPV